jgi:hypothetical protein
MNHIDPYDPVAALVARAERAADQLAAQDPFGEWSHALALVSLARVNSTAGHGDEGDADEKCVELLASALRAIDDIPGEQRRPSHTLDRAYIAGALARVQDLSA